MTDQVNDIIDEIEAIMLENPDECPVKHLFVPGMYVRIMFAKAGDDGMWVTSMIHKTIHPFFLLKGRLSILSENDGVQEIEAPFYGITYPGTRRLAKVHEDMIWATCHVTDIRPRDNSDEAIDEAVALIEEQIIEPHVNKVVGGIIRNNVIEYTQENKTLTQ